MKQLKLFQLTLVTVLDKKKRLTTLKTVSYIGNNICKPLGELQELNKLKIRELFFPSKKFYFLLAFRLKKAVAFFNRKDFFIEKSAEFASS